MQSGAIFDDDAGDAGRSVARIDGENSIFSARDPARRETGLSLHYREHCGPKSAETLQRKAVRSIVYLVSNLAGAVMVDDNLAGKDVPGSGTCIWL